MTSTSETHAGQAGGVVRAYSIAGAVLVLAIAGVTAVDVFGRYFFSRPLKGAYDIIEILMALTIFWFLPQLSAAGEHVCVTLLKDRPHALADRLRRAFIELCCAATAAALAWQLARAAAQFIRQSEVSVVLGLPKGPVVAVCAAVGVLVVLTHLWRLPRVLRRSPA